MFKSREDVYNSKTFETQEEALDYVKQQNDIMKKSGYVVMDMGIREIYDYQSQPATNIPGEHVPAGYAGTIAAKKEAASEDNEATTTETVN